MSNPITFSKGENLSAAKLNSLSARTQAGQISGNVQKSKGGALFGTPDGSNFIDALRPFDVEWATNTSILVRGGSIEHYASGTRAVALLNCDGGNSSDPFDFKTISPTLVASTEYTVYTELKYADDSLVAKAVKSADYPIADASFYREALTTFETTSTGNIPSFDPANSKRIAVGAAPYPFEVLEAGGSLVTVRGGSILVHDIDGSGQPVLLDDGDGGTIESQLDVTETINMYLSQYLFLDLDTTDATSSNWTLELIGSSSPVGPVSPVAGHRYYMIANNITWVTTTADIEQRWFGGSFEVELVPDATDDAPETLGGASAVGTSDEYARADHNHGPNPDGWSGSWVNANGDTVTVEDGIITDVAP